MIRAATSRPRWVRLRPLLAGAAATIALGSLAVAPAGASQNDGPQPVPTPLLAAMQKDMHLTAAQAQSRLAHENSARRIATALDGSLGRKVTSMWFDAGTGRLHVAVTTAADALTAEQAGAEAFRVPYTRSGLDAVARTVGVQARGVPGVVGWGIGARTSRVEVIVDRNRSTAATDAFVRRISELGDRVLVTRTSDAPVQQQGNVVGGEKWTPGSESPCSVGFSVNAAGGAKGFLTAGHCTNDVDQPAYGKDGSRLGTSNAGGTHSINAREGDFGLVSVDQPGWNVAPTVSGYGSGDVTVTGSADGLVGQTVCRSGQTSGWHCGEITKVNQTVDYGSVVIDGLSWTNTCSAGGDSGGSYVTATGGKAVGVHSGGGSVVCGQSGETNTIFQPVNEALQKWSLTLATSAPQPGDVTVAAVGAQSSTVGQKVTLGNTAQGGTAPYTWSATGLPAGLSIDSGTGTVSGATSTAGAGQVTVTATDAAGKSGSTTFTWTVGDSGGGTLSMTNPGGQTVYTGRPFTLALKATGGTGARTFNATGLPAGLSVNRTTGVIAGTPTTWGLANSRVTVTDGAGKSASVSITWSVFS
ncbi:putative Ig domain-containing protein [Streptomyces beijiangensis]|uniref:Ig domain-containing protein n=1 Tax=Streptomyces beijiangensis TaxID=163361 RepID=A0A939F7C5_9ACTN|nr:putative Ig domain-containing protein [Streptomyces beijiangensis]MBO0513906.1 putative Ig domain-containing protein [Streptomyces beijiangensis]